METSLFHELMGLAPEGINPHKDSLTLYDYEALDELEQDYLQKLPLLSQPAPQTIPKRLHFIWVGPNPFPEESIANIHSWISFNPDWQLYFWTDRDERACPIECMQKQLITAYDFGILAEYIARTPHPAEKADIMRYAIIRDLGGFYADHDASCLHSFAPLLRFDLVAGLEYPHWHGGLDSAVIFANGLFGARAAHPLFARTIQHLIRLWKELDDRFPDNAEPAPRWKIIRRSFDPFSLAIKEEFQQKSDRCNLLLPSSYFFPDIIWSEETIKNYLKQGVVWARHSYTKLW